MPQVIEVIKGFAVASEHEDSLKETLESLVSSAEEDGGWRLSCWFCCWNFLGGNKDPLFQKVNPSFDDDLGGLDQQLRVYAVGYQNKAVPFSRCRQGYPRLLMELEVKLIRMFWPLTTTSVLNHQSLDAGTGVFQGQWAATALALALWHVQNWCSAVCKAVNLAILDGPEVAHDRQCLGSDCSNHSTFLSLWSLRTTGQTLPSDIDAWLERLQGRHWWRRRGFPQICSLKFSSFSSLGQRKGVYFCIFLYILQSSIHPSFRKLGDRRSKIIQVSVLETMDCPPKNAAPFGSIRN